MKKIFTLIIAMVLTVSLYAYYGQSKLSISATGKANLRVMVDGNKYRANNNVIMINDLEEGYHTIKIFLLKNKKGGVFGNPNKGYQQVYSSRVYVKSGYFTDIVVNRFGKAFIDEQPVTYGYYDEEDDDWYDIRNTGGENYDNQAMNTQSFEQFKRAIKNEHFDDTRLSIAKQVISSNYFTSAQVKEIVQQFSFESSKLDIAKYAYKYTLDKGSYFIVNEVFSFSSSKEELQKYILANK